MCKMCKVLAAAKGALMMIASIWDLFSEVTNASIHHIYTKLCSSHLGNPTTDIYWSGALAVLQSVRITTVTKYNKRRSRPWFMSSAQGGRREIRQEEIVTRVWPQQKPSPLILGGGKKDFYFKLTAVTKEKKNYGHAHMSSVMDCVKDMQRT